MLTFEKKEKCMGDGSREIVVVKNGAIEEFFYEERSFEVDTDENGKFVISVKESK